MDHYNLVTRKQLRQEVTGIVTEIRNLRSDMNGEVKDLYNIINSMKGTIDYLLERLEHYEDNSSGS